MKRCTRCNKEKDLSLFNKDKRVKDGHAYYCRVCSREKANEWGKNNRKKIRGYYKKAYKNNIVFKLGKRMRNRLGNALNGQYKNGSTVENMGCSIKELKQYLEELFQPGMSWENHGNFGWHIDHIKPLASFDLTNAEQLKKHATIPTSNLCGLKRTSKKASQPQQPYLLSQANRNRDSSNYLESPQELGTQGWLSSCTLRRTILSSLQLS